MPAFGVERVSAFVSCALIIFSCTLNFRIPGMLSGWSLLCVVSGIVDGGWSGRAAGTSGGSVNVGSCGRVKNLDCTGDGAKRGGGR